MFDLKNIINNHTGENYNLHKNYINPQFAKVLKTIGFDKVYTRAEGQYLFDNKNNRILDMLSGYGMFNIGRNHPVAKQAMHDFINLDYPSLTQMDASLLSGLLAKQLSEQLPENLDTTFFTNSGTEGVETAIKYAHCATGKKKIIYCDHAFHGLSNGSLSLNGGHQFRDGFEPLEPHTINIPFNNLASLEQALQLGDIAAFIIEPIQGKGVYVADDDYLIQAKILCEKHEVLFIVDEVQSGLGRSGKLFAFEYADIKPDILIISKSLSAGFIPVGAVVTSKSIYNKIFSSMDRCVVHSSTFGQGAMAMVAGLATLDILETDNLIQNSFNMGRLLREGLRDLSNQFEMLSDVRGRGLMIGLEFSKPKSLSLKMGWDMAQKIQKGLVSQAMVISLFADYGILTQVAGHECEIIKLIPPLCLTENDVEYFLASFKLVLQKSHRFPGPMFELTKKMAKIAVTSR